MIIDVNGQSMLLPPSIEEKIVEQVYLMILGKYSSFPKPMRIAAKAFSRDALRKLEEEINKLGKDGKQIRPKDGEDPTMHYLKIMLGGIQEGLRESIVLIDTQEGSPAITAFSLSIQNPGKGGGSISFSGDIGQREDNSRQDVGSSVGEVIPNEQTLHL